MAKALKKYFLDEAECGDDDDDDEDLTDLELNENIIDREQAELDSQMVGFFYNGKKKWWGGGEV